MSARPSRAPQLVVALVLSAAATLIVAALHLLERDYGVELLALDLRFSHLSTARGGERIVHIDIDDRSLSELGRWTWPRAQLAGIVDILRRAGAEAIALDIIMPEPQKVRPVSAATDIYSPDSSELIGTFNPQPIFDDDVLRKALLRCPKVFIPMHVRPRPDEPTELERRVGELLDSGERSFRKIRNAVLPDLGDDTRGEQLETLGRSYLKSRGLAALERFSVPADRVKGHPRLIGEITPPLVTLAEACYSSGFVTFSPDRDGVVRRIRMLCGSGENTYPQFAMVLAADQLGNEHGETFQVSADEDSVTIAFPDGFSRTIPTDKNGRMLINWSRGAGGDSQSRHISAAKIGNICRLEESLATNTVRRRLLHFELISMGRTWTSEQMKELCFRIAALDGELNEINRKLTMAKAKRLQALVFDPDKVPPPPDDLMETERRLESEIDQLCEQFRRELTEGDNLRVFLSEPGSEDPGPPQASKDRAERFLSQIARIETANTEIRADLERQIQGLRELVGGKLCLIGSVSTGAADFVPTPIDRRMPGVWVHSNILNTILSGEFIRRWSTATNVTVILLSGLIVGFIAAVLPVLQAGPLVILAAGTYSALNALAFAFLNLWVPVVAPLGAMVGAFLIVTAYRQLTEERAKRRIRGMFAHALSPALVDRLIEDPSLAKLGGERRELTFFFSDLQGFTPLSERLGEERTVKLLNRYFDRMTDVVQNRHGGYLNKFLGDGLFVFFGAPVLQDDHPARAIRAAIESQQELSRLNRQLAEELDSSVHLRLRIGIATGDVMVGNCGSTQRMDYTAIGDPVNLASRLEAANKFFGTRILVSDDTWKKGGADDLLARPLGKVLVVGKAEPVNIWELACQTDAAEDLKDAYRSFAEGVALMNQRKFADAERIFEQILRTVPSDRPTEICRDLSRQYRNAPPPEDYNGALQLTEK